MQALVIDQRDPWEKTKGFKKVELDKPKLNEVKNPDHKDWVIVRVLKMGVCGSDKSIWFRKAFKEMIYNSLKKEGKNQRIIGHELFGQIEEMGSNVKKELGFKKGDYVSAESHIICDQCYQCKRGEKHVCANETILGIGIDGGYAKYVLLPAKVLWKTDPEKIQPEIACLQEPFGNAVHASTEVDPKNQTVVILGCGPIGLMSILIVKTLGAKKIITTDPNDNKLALAKEFGAEATIKTVRESEDGFDANLVKKVLEKTENIGADIVLEMAGYQMSVNNAIQTVRRGGQVILFGLKSGDMLIKDFDRMIVRGITIHSIIGRHIFKNWETTKKILEDTKNNVQKNLWQELLNSGRGTILPFSKYTPESFEKALTENPKIVVDLEK